MGSKPSSRKRNVTAAEADLWAHAMRGTKALVHKGRPRDDREESSTAETSRPSAKQQIKPPAANEAEHGYSRAPTTRQPAAPASSTPPLSNFDHKHRRKLARNSDAIDSRIDLHGMRQREAHSALRRFLTSAVARGYRNVLVITGKGTKGELEHTRDFYMERRGVLRRLVPQWLNEPDLRGLVVSFTTASARHGGEGALYVRLRKGRGG